MSAGMRLPSPEAPDRHWFIDRIAERVLFACSVLVLLCVVGLLLFLTLEGVGFLLRQLDGGGLASFQWRSSTLAPYTGMLARVDDIVGVALLAVAICLPVSFGAAIFLAGFVQGRTRVILKSLLEVWAVVPAVVWGFLALTILNPWTADLFDAPLGLGVFDAALILAWMAGPLVTTLADDALMAVPDHYRETAAALGADRWQTAYKVVLPAAGSGLLAAGLLGMGRVFAEVMTVVMVSGHLMPAFFLSGEAGRGLMASLVAALGRTPADAGHEQPLFAIGLLFVLIVLSINALADRLVRGGARRA